jgi:uncharacterized protein with NAD-binding domain and iron-sulfur cluster
MVKPNIAILGGGVSAITAAMQLSDDPQWRDHFESITIYQLGWRLGGKGATGRIGAANRILEHGLHIWLGYYENAFRLIQKIYGVAGRPSSSPIPTWEKAFTGQDDVGVVDHSDGVWNPWIFHIPTNEGVPGDGKVPRLPISAAGGVDWLGRTWIDLGAKLSEVEAFELGSRLIRLAPLAQEPVRSKELMGALKELSARCARYRTQSHFLTLDLKAWLTLVETAATIMLGILAENISSYADLEKLEGIDFAKWLSKYSIDASIADLAVNPLLRGMYDFAFAFQNGDIDLPNFAASPALRTIFRMCLTYKGSIFYKMNAGMGDTIFAPAYQALVKRGVGVKFFHKVKSLQLSADKSRIAAVRFGLQATVKSEPYRPLKPVSVKQGLDPLPCWPDHPLYDQLVDGQALSDSKANLESFWCQRPDVGETTLTVADIDKVVFAISLGSIPYLCSELLAASSAWRHLAKVATVRTQSLQLWLKETIQQLGWNDASPVLDAWVEPFDTWADMTDILAFETWGTHRPGSLAYFCGAMAGGIPAQSDAGFPARALAKANANADRMLSRDIQTLWPSVGPHGLGASAVAARHVRPNIDPSERYVQSLANSAQYRLTADGSGFSNLVLTGDWIQNGYNAGCVESAVWSGIQAANTILGRPINYGVITG